MLLSLSLFLSLKKKMLFTSADLIDEGKGLKIINLSRFFMEKKLYCDAEFSLAFAEVNECSWPELSEISDLRPTQNTFPSLPLFPLSFGLLIKWK